MNLMLAREIILVLLMALQFTVAAYHRVRDSQSVRQIVSGTKDQWLHARNGLIIIAAVVTFYSIDSLLPFRPSEQVILVSSIFGSVIWSGSLCLYIWSRNVLNTQFNPSMIIYEDHKLVTAGPYGIIRHPIYLSYLGSLIGASLVSFSLATVIGGGIGAVWMLLRINSEEQILVQKFGTAYVQYQNQTGKLFPKIRFFSKNA